MAECERMPVGKEKERKKKRNLFSQKERRDYENPYTRPHFWEEVLASRLN
ncbi:MAG: hypothetical protein ACTSYN_04540 [Candidatus Heimdallarchaeaceae archaeon]